jgi:hypothetical protein
MEYSIEVEIALEDYTREVLNMWSKTQEGKDI